MSEENVQLFHKALEGYNRRDIEAMLEIWHPDAEWYPFTAQVEGDDAYHGHEGLRQWWANVDATFEGLRRVLRRFETSATPSSHSATFAPGSGAVSRWTRQSAGSPATAMVLPSGVAHTKAMPRPSKPPGLRSSRCRRRTSR